MSDERVKAEIIPNLKSNGAEHRPGRIDARGALLGDFEVAGKMAPHEVPGAIEGDRAIFVARPGFYRKLIPLRLENDGTLFSGGRYLFETYDQVSDFSRWFRDEFRLDGKLFVERSWVKDFSRLTFHVLGAHDFKDVHDSQLVVRAERWALNGERGAALESAWPELRDRAADRGLASAWLLFSDERREAALITVADRVGRRDPTAPDVASLRALEAQPSLAEELSSQGWARKTFDRTSWIFTIWFAPDHRPLSLWPNSPPLPGFEPAEAVGSNAK
jgi:hypothetical protein